MNKEAARGSPRGSAISLKSTPPGNHLLSFESGRYIFLFGVCLCKWWFIPRYSGWLPLSYETNVPPSRLRSRRLLQSKRDELRECTTNIDTGIAEREDARQDAITGCKRATLGRSLCRDTQIHSDGVYEFIPRIFIRKRLQAKNSHLPSSSSPITV